jgi:hypothetical protein
MAVRTLKLDISFQELLAVVDQLELDEKMFLKKNWTGERSLLGRSVSEERFNSSVIKIRGSQ